ncbi:unnamed protein product [Microthlaspi erraticum]|uniref:Zinc knuckle CX2CX4HX4C domain-containing protein n=1 Tax=Microthlaspi erraticum TaxID=1685480 RepID=A0A6D2HNV5_9BRAS|nr:unnamed protein product [Microthlaspi erraticum]
MNWLARRVGEVIEIAYGTKGPQKETFVHAHVKLKIADPPIQSKMVNLSTRGSVTIENKYDKLRKYCFHCHGINDERPMCPFSHNRIPSMPLKHRVEQTVMVADQALQLVSVVADHPSVMPGFPPFFAELPMEERHVALQYVSHSDTTERQARIERVKQSIENPHRCISQTFKDIS